MKTKKRIEFNEKHAAKKTKKRIEFNEKHAAKLAAILEEHGWLIYNGNEYYCTECENSLTGTEITYSFCPQCGANMRKCPPSRDEDQMASTHQFIVECVREAME